MEALTLRKRLKINFSFLIFSDKHLSSLKVELFETNSLNY